MELGDIAYFVNTVSSQFDCTSRNDGFVSTPNIPNSYFTSSSAASFRALQIPKLETAMEDITYVFTIPAASGGSQHDCRGNVLAFEYCYTVDSIGNDVEDLFYFLSLTTNQQGSIMNAVVDKKFLIRVTSSLDNCTITNRQGDRDYTCCGTYTLQPPNNVFLPTSSFTFGILVENKLLAISTHVPTFNSPQYQISQDFSIGDRFVLAPRFPSRPLLLLRFIIGEYNLASSTASKWLSTNQPNLGTPPTPDPQTDLTTPSPSDPVTTTPLPTDAESTQLLTDAGTNQPTTIAEKTLPNDDTDTSHIPTAPSTTLQMPGFEGSPTPADSSAGGVIGGVVVALLLVLVAVVGIVVVIVVLVGYQRNKKTRSALFYGGRNY